MEELHPIWSREVERLKAAIRADRQKGEVTEPMWIGRLAALKDVLKLGMQELPPGAREELGCKSILLLPVDKNTATLKLIEEEEE